MRDLIRLTLRIHRFEVLAVVLGSLVLAAAAIGIALQLEAVHVPLACFGRPDVHGATGSQAPECQDALAAFTEIDTREGQAFLAVMVAFPVLAGLFLGVPAVSRELERGTAPLAWTLTGARGRWLGRRILVLVAALLAGLIPLALAADLLEGARAPLVDPSVSFGSEGLRGAVLVARGLAGLLVGVLIGLVVGRQLPALIVAMVAAGILLVAGLLVMDGWSRSSAVYLPLDQARLGDRSIEAALRGRDGSIVTFSAIASLQPSRPDLPPGTIDEGWIADHFDEVLLLVPGARYGEEATLHSGLLLVVGAVAAGASLFLVRSRRAR